MLQIAIVVFREILEIALILGILVSATKEIPNRSKWISSGLFFGLLTAALLAFFTDKISESLDGVGQEFFNGLILITASSMIAWTVLWMQKHAKSISKELREISNSIKTGNKPLYALFFVVFFSVLREGAEIVLFVYSYYISQVNLFDILAGLTIGILLGCSFGYAIYLGMLKLFGKYFFKITTWLLVFISAGIASAGIGFWINAELIPSFINPIFDLSNILPEQSFFGKFLHIFFGYIDQPSATQFFTYLAVVIFLSIGLKMSLKK
jgi:high-affinity iron transporter